MDKKKKELIKEAKKSHNRIFPCGGKPWEECFTVHDDKLLLWFNTEDKSTKVVAADLNLV